MSVDGFLSDSRYGVLNPRRHLLARADQLADFVSCFFRRGAPVFFRVFQVELLREAYGPNAFPEIPMKGFCILFAESFNDTILLVLIAAAVVSLIIGMIEHPDTVSLPFICRANQD